MNDIHKILKILYPFNFLTKEERNLIVQHAEPMAFNKKDIILQINENNDYIYLLSTGTVDVYGNQNERISSISSPSYFGDRSVFFCRPTNYTFKATTQVECFKIKGDLIINAIGQNQSFSRAFATTLRSKQKIFGIYEKFITQLLACKNRGFLTISELSETYKQLTPALHKDCLSDKIDFAALKYVLGHLPKEITNTSEFYLAQSLPKIYQEIFRVNQSLFIRKRKKYTLNVLPGKVMVVLRDELSDYISFITKLCVYYHETKKIVDRITKNSRAIAKLTELYLKDEPDTLYEEELLPMLPFSQEEQNALEQLFSSHIIKSLYEIVAQNGDINIHLHETTFFYNISAEEIWLSKIRTAISSVFKEDVDFKDLKFHIISSNIHSVNNSLSSWMQKHKKEILDWGNIHFPDLSQLSNENDRLYYTAKKWFNVFPERFNDRQKSDFLEGITYCEDSSLTGMDVSVINPEKLVGPCDSFITLPDREKLKNNIIINMDYAYGKQVEVSIRNLILLLGKQIKTISVIGKAGGISGNRGDLFIPEDIIIQKNDVLYPVVNANLHPSDLKKVGWKNDIHQGSMLTVLGTLMQNPEMLRYYNLFWNVLALDMESGYYMEEVNKAFFHHYLDKDLKVHMAYYISDMPLVEGKNLSASMSPEEGVPAVYTITRAILNKIFTLIEESSEK